MMNEVAQVWENYWFLKRILTPSLVYAVSHRIIRKKCIFAKNNHEFFT